VNYFYDTLGAHGVSGIYSGDIGRSISITSYSSLTFFLFVCSWPFDMLDQMFGSLFQLVKSSLQFLQTFTISKRCTVPPLRCYPGWHDNSFMYLARPFERGCVPNYYNFNIISEQTNKLSDLNNSQHPYELNHILSLGITNRP